MMAYYMELKTLGDPVAPGHYRALGHTHPIVASDPESQVVHEQKSGLKHWECRRIHQGDVPTARNPTEKVGSPGGYSAQAAKTGFLQPLICL